MALSTKPNRFYPSIPTVSEDVQTHLNALIQIKESLETHERRNANYQKSFVRFEELVDLGIIDEDGENLLASGGGTTDHTELTNIGVNTHDQIDTHIANGAIHLSAGSTTHATLRWNGTDWVENDQFRTGSFGFTLYSSDLLQSSDFSVGVSTGVLTISTDNGLGDIVLNPASGVTRTDINDVIQLVGGFGSEQTSASHDGTDLLIASTSTTAARFTGITRLALEHDDFISWRNAGDTADVDLLEFTGTEGQVANDWGTNTNDDWTYIGITHDTTALEATGICQNFTFGMDILHVSDDGLNVIVGNNSDDQIQSHVLDSAYDFSNSTQTGTTRGLTNPWYSGQWTNSGNGYIIQTADNNLREFTTSSAYQISSGDSNIRTQSNSSLGFPTSGETSYWMSRDGTRLIGCGDDGTNDVFRVFNLTTPYNISTFSLLFNARMDNITNGPAGQFEGYQWSDDGLTVIGIHNARVWIGTCTAAYDVTTLAFELNNERSVQTDTGGPGSDAAQVHVETDGNTFWVMSDNAASPKLFEYNKTVPNDPQQFIVGDPNYPTDLQGTEVTINGNPIDGNATHTGEVTGSVALTVQVESITNRTAVGEVSESGTDDLALHDATDGSLKKTPINLVTDGGNF